jgi:tetratricopeptide (TPR) repeat protein
MAKRFAVELKISRHLLNVGLLASRLKRFAQAEQILRAMQAYRADIPQPNDFLALCLISQGRLDEAERELKASLTRFPDNQMSKALLGVVYRESGRAGGDKLLQEVLDDGRCEHAMQLAKIQTQLGGVPPGPSERAPVDTGVSISHAHRMYA